MSSQNNDEKISILIFLTLFSSNSFYLQSNFIILYCSKKRENSRFLHKTENIVEMINISEFRKSLLQLMKKLLLHLIAEFKRLGAVIIFADFNRIIISTKKRQYSDASTYVDYISEHIRNKEMFHCINIR